MMKVAVTGNVASGKSLLTRTWAREGVPVVSADALAREAVEPGTPGLEKVVAAFGHGILREDGLLDRERLRARVFADSAERERLEGILHPIIRTLRDAWMNDRALEGASVAAAEIPLLYEVGMEGEFDVVVFVEAPDGERLRRLTEFRGLEEEEARRIMNAQAPSGEKLRRADYVVHNTGTEEDLEIRALALLDLLRAKAAGGGHR